MEGICRICLSDDRCENMCSPCLCKGTSKYVHHECLNKWQRVGNNKDRYYRCGVCLYRYRFITEISVWEIPQHPRVLYVMAYYTILYMLDILCDSVLLLVSSFYIWVITGTIAVNHDIIPSVYWRWWICVVCIGFWMKAINNNIKFVSKQMYKKINRYRKFIRMDTKNILNRPTS